MAYAPLPGVDVQSYTIGVKESQKKMRKILLEQGAKGAEEGVYQATEWLKRMSVKVTPKETGDLRASVQTQYAGSGFNKKGIISYNTFYAIYVHEDLTKYHAPGTYAKYLQRPVWENRARATEIVAERIRARQRG